MVGTRSGRPGRALGLGPTLEQSRAGRAPLTLVMVVLALAVVGYGLPRGPLNARATRASGRVLLPLGIDQDWAIFSPDPRSFSVGLAARVRLADGRTVSWRPPDAGLVLAPYRTYRWQKYVERVRGDDYSALWDPTARRIAVLVAHAQHQAVTQVVLVRAFRPVTEPGSGTGRAPEQRVDFFTLDLP